jgi:hypothetical protein
MFFRKTKRQTIMFLRKTKRKSKNDLEKDGEKEQEWSWESQRERLKNVFKKDREKD